MVLPEGGTEKKLRRREKDAAGSRQKIVALPGFTREPTGKYKTSAPTADGAPVLNPPLTHGGLPFVGGINVSATLC